MLTDIRFFDFVFFFFFKYFQFPMFGWFLFLTSSLTPIPISTKDTENGGKASKDYVFRVHVSAGHKQGSLY